MAKIKLTKGELKRQRDSLKQFEHYLPILLLKKQQLQFERERIRRDLKQKIEEIDALEGEISDWSGLLNEERGYIAKWVSPKEVVTKDFNIAGVDIPILERVDFEEPEYDLYIAPLWVDTAIEKIKGLVVLLEEEKILKSQIKILERELRVTTQRVNLFEKVKIPECKENVRLIRIYLGEQETNAVGRSKIAKSKIERVIMEEVTA
ncbi:MAG: V-type ATP synthase subunit D [Candidatus Omnitrophica bacterium]|nr:V-type ATP synthase subunit D [Candidatus Omnitrophota bacterium]MBU1932295.1 V-type ATP synthase subunit D [Candidatus Omnitrophota bacterium]